APKAARRITHIMRSKDQPASGAGVAFNGLFNRIEVMATLLDEKCVHVIQVNGSGIERLATTAGAVEMSSHSAFGFWPRPTDRIREAVEGYSGRVPSDRLSIAQNGTLKLVWARFP